jgi:hypothetical protein
MPRTRNPQSQNTTDTPPEPNESQTPPDGEATPPPPPPEPAKEVEITEKAITVPLATSQRGHVPRHVEVQLSLSQGRALKSLQIALEESRMRKDNGRPVVSKADAIRWLLEQLSIPIEAKTA